MNIYSVLVQSVRVRSILQTQLNDSWLSHVRASSTKGTDNWLKMFEIKSELTRLTQVTHRDVTDDPKWNRGGGEPRK
jgi:hypothetical protein